MEKFRVVDAKKLNENFFKLIGDNYALITVNDGKQTNMMTASWGFFGVMWNRNAVSLVIRPSRHTYKLLRENSKFTLNFLSDGYKDAYAFCGTKSGRDYDKVKETGLLPIQIDKNLISFSEAKYTFVCNVMYMQDMSKEYFLDSVFAEKMYPDGDIHTIFIAEIEKVYAKID